MIVVTGSSGQVGSELIKLLKKNKIKHIDFNKKQLDITSQKSIKKNLEKVINLKTIINLAAFTNVEKSELLSSKNYKVNLNGIKNLCKYLKNRNILFINISTDYVFDGNTKQPYREKDKTNPLNRYGTAKDKAEKYIRKSIEKYIILRSSWIFSKEKSSFFNFINNSRNRKLFLINDIYGNPTSARSLCLAIIKVLKIYNKNRKLKYGIYHFCNYPKTNWLNFGKYYANFKGYDLSKICEIKSEDLMLKAVRPKNSSLSSQKFEKEFNFKRIYWKKEIKNFL